jgi:hypothetical protein
MKAELCFVHNFNIIVVKLCASFSLSVLQGCAMADFIWWTVTWQPIFDPRPVYILFLVDRVAPEEVYP